MLGRILSTITALERRFAEWGSDPGTPAELKALRKALSALQRLMNETLAKEVEPRGGEVGEISGATQRL
jgi:hypothetical protein